MANLAGRGGLAVRHVGLAPTTPLPPSAMQVALTVMMLGRFEDVPWSAEVGTIERVLAFLKADGPVADAKGAAVPVSGAAWPSGQRRRS